jgi:hypothetical protein
MRLATLILICSFAVAGCGGDDNKASTDGGSTPPAASDATAADAAAKSHATELVTVVESCFIDTMDYSQCNSADELAAATDLTLGSKPGQVEVLDATAKSFRIVGHSESGNTFTLEPAATAGDYKRSCDVTEGDGGCQGGTW